MRKNTAVVFDWLKVLQEIQTYQRKSQIPLICAIHHRIEANLTRKECGHTFDAKNVSDVYETLN